MSNPNKKQKNMSRLQWTHVCIKCGAQYTEKQKQCMVCLSDIKEKDIVDTDNDNEAQ